MKISKETLKLAGLCGGTFIGGFAVRDLIERYKSYQMRKKIEKTVAAWSEGFTEALKNYKKEENEESEEEA